MSKTTLIIIGIVGGFLLLGLLTYLLLNSTSNLGPGGGGTPVALQFWGVYDDASFYSEAINAYQQLHPNVRITYHQLPYAEYEAALINGFAAGNGPDIWLMHNSWLPKHGDLISPLPATAPAGEKASLFTLADFRNQFVDGTAADLTNGTAIYGLPLYVDSLALYYNKNYFNTAGIAAPPATWNDFNSAVHQLTQFDKKHSITRAGAAIGTAKNINRSTDLLVLLMLQSGVPMINPDHSEAIFSSPVGGQSVGEVAVQYYTDFANPSKDAVYTWNDQQHYSVDAFLEGNAAMLFNYSHQIPVLRQRASRFDFGIAPMPQVQAAADNVNYADYWAPTVWKGSKNTVEAWRFLVYLSSSGGAAKYVNASSRPAARRDLLAQQQSDPDLGVFAKQALSARSWYQPDDTAVEQILATLIDDVNYGRAPIRDALQTAESKVNVLLQKTRR